MDTWPVKVSTGPSGLLVKAQTDSQIRRLEAASNANAPPSTTHTESPGNASTLGRHASDNTLNISLWSMASRFLPIVKPPPHFRFLDLPAEIRLMVYEDILVVGKVFFTPDDHDIRNGRRCREHKLFSKPELQLLRACKRIHSEAEPVYLSKNLFVLPIRFREFRPFVKIGHLYRHLERTSDPRYIFSNLALIHVKNVSVAIDQSLSEFRSTRSFEDWQRDALDDEPSFEELTPTERYDVIHDAELYSVLEDWQDTLHLLTFFQTGLNYLELDFTNAFCPTGDCRPIPSAIDWWLAEISPNMLDVIGLRTREERREFITATYNAGITHRKLREEYGLRFRKPTDTTPWEKWMTEGDLEDENKLYTLDITPLPFDEEE